MILVLDLAASAGVGKACAIIIFVPGANFSVSKSKRGCQVRAKKISYDTTTVNLSSYMSNIAILSEIALRKKKTIPNIYSYTVPRKSNMNYAFKNTTKEKHY